MSGINAGILTNATPLTTEQIEVLEQQILSMGGSIVYLDQNNDICFMSSSSPDSVKDIAWHNAYQLATEESILTKKVYQKSGLKSFDLKRFLLKNALTDDWLPSLPNEYQGIEYLENTGTQYINLGIRPDNNTSVELVYQALAYAGSQYILGARATSSSSITYALNGSNSNTLWNFRANDNITKCDLNREASHMMYSKVTLNNGAGTWLLKDLDTDQALSTQLSEIEVLDEAPLFLFGFNSSNIHRGLRVYSCKIYKQNQLILNLLPCYRKQDNKGGMYDLVNNQFYTNTSTSVFVKGPNI